MPPASAPSGAIGALTRSSPWSMVLAQFFPVLALSLVYPLVESRLNALLVDGGPMSVIVISCAVITPTLAQAVAAPIYLGLLRAGRDDAATTSAVALRLALPAVAIVLPIVVAALIPVVLARALTPTGTAVLAGLLLLHVLMGALLVPAYALRAPVLLVVGWTVYAVALLLAPEQLWLGAAAACAAEAVLLALVAHGPAVQHGPLGPIAPRLPDALMAALRGAAEGLPLWSVPVLIWLLDTGLDSIGFVYAALLPAVLAHQLFFVQVVDPGWKRLDHARRALSAEPHDRARHALDHFASGIGAGIGRAAGLLLALAALLVVASVAFHWSEAPLLVLVVVASSAAVLLMMQGYTIAMVGSSLPLALTGAAAVGLIAAGVLLGLPDQAVLLTATGLYAAGAVALLPVRRAAMRDAEYRMFWRTAISA